MKVTVISLDRNEPALEVHWYRVHVSFAIGMAADRVEGVNAVFDVKVARREEEDSAEEEEEQLQRCRDPVHHKVLRSVA